MAPPHLKFHLHKRFTSQSKFEGNLFFFIACSFISNRAPFYSAGSDTSTLEYKSVSFRTSVSSFFFLCCFFHSMYGMHASVFFVRACMHSNISDSKSIQCIGVCTCVCFCSCFMSSMLCFVWRDISRKVQRPPGGCVPQRNKGTTAPQISVMSGGWRRYVRWNNYPLPSPCLHTHTHTHHWVWTDMLPVYQMGSSYSTA